VTISDSESVASEKGKGKTHARTFEVGSFLKARFSRLNKQNKIAENRLGDYRALGTHTCSFVSDLCKVEKVVRLTPQEYDRFSNSLLWHVDYLGSGGFGIENPDPELARHLDIRPRRLWPAKARSTWTRRRHRLVTVIKSKSRETFVVDAHGDTYARYVGLEPIRVPRQLLERTASPDSVSSEKVLTRFFGESEIREVIQDLLSTGIRFTVEAGPVSLYKISVNSQHAAILSANRGASTIEEACTLYGISPSADTDAGRAKISI
jgi:hypothetical protein